MRPLPPPGVRALRWLAAAAVLMIVAIVMMGSRDDFASALTQPIFLGSLAALLLTMASGAFGGFLLSVPGAERSPAPRALPVLAAVAWPAIWLAVLLGAEEPEGPRTAAIHSACVIQIAVGALATGALLFVMISRAAPLRPVWTAAVASLASMAAGAALAQVLCPLDDPRHQLIGHALVGLMVAGAGLAVGRRTLKTWRQQ